MRAREVEEITGKRRDRELSGCLREQPQGKGERREEGEEGEEEGGPESITPRFKEKTAAELLNSFPLRKSLLQATNGFS